MATITRTEGLKEKRPLQPVTAGGWRRGFANLLRKELGQWWGTKMWWVQLIIWVFLLNGIAAIMMITESQAGEVTTAELLQEVVQTFLLMGATVIGIGVVITGQDAIVGEKQSGTAAWVMSKPASRPAFILAKEITYVLGFGIVAIIVPTIILIAESRLLVPLPLALPAFLAGVGLLALCVLFYLALTLMLGTVFNSRGPIIGIGIAIILAGIFFKGMFPPAVLVVTPWLLPDISAGVALGTPLPENWLVHVAITGGWILVFSAVALWRFSREEF
ncbi:MAG: ABC transporter permease subunit [Chloroflexota bacterium]|jgi:ABC-2 type transport system permease protein